MAVLLGVEHKKVCGLLSFYSVALVQFQSSSNSSDIASHGAGTSDSWTPAQG